MFYAGATYVNEANMMRTYDWTGATRLADAALAKRPAPCFDSTTSRAATATDT
jgi:hypothetical protein